MASYNYGLGGMSCKYDGGLRPLHRSALVELVYNVVIKGYSTVSVVQEVDRNPTNPYASFWFHYQMLSLLAGMTVHCNRPWYVFLSPLLEHKLSFKVISHDPTLMAAITPRQISRTVNGIETQVFIQSFVDRVLVLVTQVGKVGNLVLFFSLEL